MFCFGSGHELNKNLSLSLVLVLAILIFLLFLLSCTKDNLGHDQPMISTDWHVLPHSGQG